MISIMVMTKNEEMNLPGCLASIAWCDDIHLYDSYSTDNTVAIAQAAGAHITQRHFDNWSAHQNWGLRNIPFKHEWVFYIDADERMTKELADNLLTISQTSSPHAAYRLQRRDFFMGTWLKHVQASPFFMRFFKPEKMRFERLVNPVSIPDGSVGEVTGYLDHYPFSKGIAQWLERHNSYSTFEAQQIVSAADKQKFSLVKAFTAKDFSERRFHQKELFYRLPGRPLVKFLALYVIKRGFLDGKAGFTYALLQSIYEYMIQIKTEELRQSGAKLQTKAA